MKVKDGTRSQTLARIIDDSGLSVNEFAERILTRNDSTVRRWLSEEKPMPQPVLAWLDHWTSLSDGTRKRVIGALAPKEAPTNSLT